MDKAVEPIIRRIVRGAHSWDEAKQRVVASLGEHAVPEAEALAARLHGLPWLRKSTAWWSDHPEERRAANTNPAPSGTWGIVDGRRFGAASASEQPRSVQSDTHARRPLRVLLEMDASAPQRVELTSGSEPLNVELRATLSGLPDPAERRWRTQVATITFFAVMVATIYPPFYLPLSNGFVTNMGFALAWNPPTRGQLEALVNVPLLISEYCALLIAAILAMLWGSDAFRLWRER